MHCYDRIKQPDKSVGVPPAVSWTLWRDDNERKFFAFFYQLRWSMHCNKVEIVPPFACAVKEHQQWDFHFAVVPLRQILEVLIGEHLGDFSGETLLSLVRLGGGRGVERNKTGDECRCQF